jgi:hypothetical protein
VHHPFALLLVGWVIAEESTAKVAEVKHLVNSQQDRLDERNEALEARIEQLEALLAAK